MPLYWQCECGEKFEERGREEPGNDIGWRKAISHVIMHKRNGELEKLLGLFNEKGEMIFEGGMRPNAVKAGILPYGDWKNKNKSDFKVEEKQLIASSGKRSPYQGVVFTKPIPIHQVVIDCFYEAKARCPAAYPDDSPETISDFITECVLGVFALYPEEFNMGRLIAETLISLHQRRKEMQNAS